jgi:hypothetical protein
MSSTATLSPRLPPVVAERPFAASMNGSEDLEGPPVGGPSDPSATTYTAPRYCSADRMTAVRCSALDTPSKPKPQYRVSGVATPAPTT